MKVFILFFVLAACANGLSVVEQWSNFKVQCFDLSIDIDFVTFCHQKQYDKVYPAEEDKMRFQIFVKTLASIEEQNRKFQSGESSWAAGLNEHSDRTPEENQKRYGIPLPYANPAPAYENHHSHQRMQKKSKNCNNIKDNKSDKKFIFILCDH